MRSMGSIREPSGTHPNEDHKQELMSDDLMVEVANLTKRFAGGVAVSDISFYSQARRGRRFAWPQRGGQEYSQSFIVSSSPDRRYANERRMTR